MNGLRVAGVVVMLIGGLMTSDYKAMGMASPAIGILVGGAGFFLAAFGYFNGSQDQKGGSGKKLKDYSV
jgi:hypothetical protein